MPLAPHQSVCRTCPVPLICLPVSPSYFFLPLLPLYNFPRSLSLPFSPSLVLKHRVNWHARRDAGRSPPHPGHGDRRLFLLLRVPSVRACRLSESARGRCGRSPSSSFLSCCCSVCAPGFSSHNCVWPVWPGHRLLLLRLRTRNVCHLRGAVHACNRFPSV